MRRPNSSSQQHWGLTHSPKKNQRGKGPGYLRLRDTAAHPPLRGSVTDAVPELGTATPAVENRVLLMQTTPRAAVPSLPGGGQKSATSLLSNAAAARLGGLFSSGSLCHPQVCAFTVPAHAWAQEKPRSLVLPGSQLPLCPNSLGCCPWGFLLHDPQARFYSDHGCLFLVIPCYGNNKDDSDDSSHCGRHFTVSNSHNSNLCHRAQNY